MAIHHLRVERLRVKYGRVIVRNEDGTFNREVPLTREQYQALGQPGAGAPPGVTDDEWIAGRAVAQGKQVGVGDIAERADGSLVLMTAARVVAGRTVETHLTLTRDDYTGTAPQITIRPDALASLPARLRPRSLVDGVLDVPDEQEDGQ